MIHLIHIREIEKCLHEIPKLVDLQQHRLQNFPEHILDWLRRTEQELEKAQLAVVSEIASIRSNLLLTLHRSDINQKTNASRRKQQEYIASNALQSAQHIIMQSLNPKLEQIQEAENIANRIVSVARTKGILEGIKKIKPHKHALQHLYSKLSKDADTAAAMTHLVGILGIYDAMIILDCSTPELGQ